MRIFRFKLLRLALSIFQKYQRGHLVICNLQPTKHTRRANLNIHTYVVCLPSQKKTVFRIRIRIDLALLDPDLYWECGSGSRSKEIKYQKNLISSLSKWFCTVPT
jgi:hypothetical protein